MDQKAHSVVADQERIELLNNPDGLEASKGARTQPLVSVDLIDCDLHLPSFMVGTHQFQGWTGFGIEQGGNQSMNFSIAGQGRIGQSVFDDSNKHRFAFFCGVCMGVSQVLHKG
jgi:hypothetical protein